MILLQRSGLSNFRLGEFYHWPAVPENLVKSGIMPNAYLVYNPAAGRYPSGLLTEQAEKILSSAGWNIRLEKTQNGEHITELAYRAVEEEMDAFFIVGGDGSINHAIPGLLYSNTALGVLPAGTANVWAQELGLPGLSWTRWMALEESARRLAHAKVRSTDIGMCSGRPFLLWAGVGLDAFIVNRIEPRSRWEKHFAVVHYAATSIWNASLWHGIHLNVRLDGHSIEGNFLLGVVSNIHLYAGGLTELFPEARLDDGYMDLWLFKGQTLGDTVQLAWELFSGDDHESDQVIRTRFQSMQLQAEGPVYVQIDGEPMEVDGSLDITVESRALKVLVPQVTPHVLFEQNESISAEKAEASDGFHKAA